MLLADVCSHVICIAIVSVGVRLLKEKKQIWDVHCRLLRAREQVVKAKRDIRAFAAYYEAMVVKLAAAETGGGDQLLCGGVLEQSTGLPHVQAGRQALLQKGVVFAVQQRELGRQLLSDIE
jgi:hypothetical protein